MKYTIRAAYWLWRTPRGQTFALVVAVAAIGYLAYFKIAKQTADQLAVIGFAAAALVAIWGVTNQWAISRRQLTVQFMRELETDHDYIDALRLFNEAADSAEGLIRLAKAPPTEKNERKLFDERRRSAWLVLNQDELIAIGIKNSILDYRVVCTLSRNAIQRRWEHSRSLIYEMRTSIRMPTMYLELQRLAVRLKNDDLHHLL